MARIRTGLHGASGRMGRAIAALIASDYADRLELTASISSSNPDLHELVDADVVIDVSLPEGTAALLDWMSGVAERPPALVCGTTGLDAALLDRIMALGDSTRVLYAANFSSGVAALHEIIAFAAPMLAALGYRPVLTETHHENKVDAPSGTARSIRQVVDPERPESIETHSIRTGAVIGTHELVFDGIDDEIVLRHDAKDRRLFARGAIEAALWIAAESGTGADTVQSYFAKRFRDRA